MLYFLIPFIPTIVYFLIRLFKKGSTPSLFGALVGLALSLYSSQVFLCGYYQEWVNKVLFGACRDWGGVVVIIALVFFVIQALVFSFGYFSAKSNPEDGVTGKDLGANLGLQKSDNNLIGGILALPIYLFLFLKIGSFVGRYGGHELYAYGWLIGVISFLLFFVAFTTYKYILRRRHSEMMISNSVLRSYAIVTVVISLITSIVPD